MRGSAAQRCSGGISPERIERRRPGRRASGKTGRGVAGQVEEDEAEADRGGLRGDVGSRSPARPGETGVGKGAAWCLGIVQRLLIRVCPLKSLTWIASRLSQPYSISTSIVAAQQADNGVPVRAGNTMPTRPPTYTDEAPNPQHQPLLTPPAHVTPATGNHTVSTPFSSINATLLSRPPWLPKPEPL